MRIVPAVVAFASAACLALAAHAQTPLKVTGDFDGDGKPDTVELVVGEGRYKLTVLPGKAPAEPVLIAYGLEKDAGDVLEVRNGGSFKTPSGRGGRPSPPLTISRDVFIYGKSDGQKFIWHWGVASFNSTPYLGPA